LWCATEAPDIRLAAAPNISTAAASAIASNVFMFPLLRLDAHRPLKRTRDCPSTSEE
jgi:hypothetical protein